MLSVHKSNWPAGLQQHTQAAAKQQYNPAYLPGEQLRSMKSVEPCTGLPSWFWVVCGQPGRFDGELATAGMLVCALGCHHQSLQLPSNVNKHR
jgi:hypothetical protein